MTPQNARIGVSLRHPHDEVDRTGEAVPVRQFLFEPFATGAREPVELRLPPRLRFPPVGCNPALLFKPIERRVERSLLYLERLLRDLLNALRDGPPVLRLEGQGLEDQGFSRAGEVTRCFSGEDSAPGHRICTGNYGITS